MANLKKKTLVNYTCKMWLTLQSGQWLKRKDDQSKKWYKAQAIEMKWHEFCGN
jgi:hypothetical protein